MSPELDFALTVLTHIAIALVVLSIVAAIVGAVIVARRLKRHARDFEVQQERIRRTIARPTRIGGAP